MQQKLRSYWNHLRDSRTDLMPLTAFSIVLFFTGDSLILWILNHLAPNAAAALEKLSRTIRILILGGLPACLLFFCVLYIDWKLWCRKK